MILTGQIFWSFAFVFFICEYGERVSNGFEELNTTLNDLKWYLLPNEIQRMLPTAMISFQAPVVVPIVGKMTCSRYIFEKVSDSRYIIAPWSFSIQNAISKCCNSFSDHQTFIPVLSDHS